MSTSPIRTVDILEIPLFAGNIPNAYDIVEKQIITGKKIAYHISACDANVLVNAQRNYSYKQILKNAYMNLPDGMPGVWVGKIKGAKDMKRCYGPDFFEYVMRQSVNEPIKHYFSGGNPGVAEALRQVCSSDFGNSHVVGCHCPPFRELSEEEIREVARDITNKQADIVWIGISSPKQEKYALRLATHAKVHFLVTVGAAFDFHTGNVKQAPKWMQKNGLEWLFRIIVEPRRLFKRYFTVVPLFIYYNLKEWIRFLTKSIVKN